MVYVIIGMENETEEITAQLRELYMMLETGRLTEAEFDEQEGPLLDRLDAIHERQQAGLTEEEDVSDEDGNEDDDNEDEDEDDV